MGNSSQTRPGLAKIMPLCLVAWKILWQHAPGWTVFNIVLTLIQGILTPLVLIIVKHLVDAVAVAGGAAHLAAIWPTVFRYVLAVAGVTLLASICRTVADVAGGYLSFRITDAVTTKLHGKVTTIDFAVREDGQFQNMFYRALLDAPSRPPRMIRGMLLIIQQTITVLGLTGILFAVNHWLTVALALAALPGAWLRWRHALEVHALTRESTELERRAGYLHWLLCDHQTAKELRLFDFGGVLSTKYQALRYQWRAAREELSLRSARADLLAQTCATLALVCALAIVTRQAVTGAITVGMLVMAFQGVLAMLSAMQTMVRGGVGLGEDALFLESYEEFLQLQPSIVTPASPRAIPAPGAAGICVHDLSFTYPEQSRVTLDNLHLELPTGRIVALVGENGSGKTTLIKLLCRLYAPAAGKITVEGVNLCELDPEEWRREISVVFQEFGCYAMTAEENIWLGDVHADRDRTRIIDAASRAQIDRRISLLPDGYDSMLGRHFSGGQALSLGEWQRLALARALLRPSRLLILDEPTSSLDPFAEEAFFNLIRNENRSRSVLLVSHRFSTVRLADDIYVLDAGRVVQHGSHDELLRQPGRYAEAYWSQAQGYQPETESGGIVLR